MQTSGTECLGWDINFESWRGWVTNPTYTGTAAAPGAPPVQFTMMEENWNGCVVLKNKPTIREFDNCAEFFRGGVWQFGDSVATPNSASSTWDSAEWMRQRVYAKNDDRNADGERRCWVHLGVEGSSQHDGNKKIRGCHEYSALKKTADWQMNGTTYEATAYFGPMEEYYDRNGLRFCIFDLPDFNDPYTFIPPMIAGMADPNYTPGDTGTGTGTGGSSWNYDTETGE